MASHDGQNEPEQPYHSRQLRAYSINGINSDTVSGNHSTAGYYCRKAAAPGEGQGLVTNPRLIPIPNM